jgi:hypothetical protein
VRRTACTTIAAGLALGGALTACSTRTGAAGPEVTAHPTGTASPLHIVQAAYTETSQAGSLQFAMNSVVTSTGLNQRLTATGVEDFSSKQVEMTMTLPAVGKEDLRIVDGVLYFRLPTAPGSADAGKWIKQSAPADMTSGDGNDAQEMLTLLKNVSSSEVSQQGGETVHGVTTTHYAATLDLTKIASKAEVSDDDSEGVSSMMKQTGMSSMPVDVFIDDQGRIRRMTLSMTMSASSVSPSAASSSPSSSMPSAGGLGSLGMTGTYTMTMDFFNFGIPVHVIAPPADQTIADHGNSNISEGMPTTAATPS